VWLPRAARSGRWAVRCSDPRPAQLRALRAAFGPAFALAHPSHRAQQARLAQPMPEDPGPIFERPCPSPGQDKQQQQHPPCLVELKTARNAPRLLGSQTSSERSESRSSRFTLQFRRRDPRRRSRSGTHDRRSGLTLIGWCYGRTALTTSTARRLSLSCRRRTRLFTTPNLYQRLQADDPHG
jgi:hypothetical protein